MKAGGAVYIMRCAPVEVVPWCYKNCTETYDLHDSTKIFMDPTSYAIKSEGSPVLCNDAALPQYQLGGKCYYSTRN
jgi:hypothetical protein